MKKRIYLDNAATTLMDERVLKEMRPFFWEKFGNASSLHSFGREAREAIEKAREKIAKAINARPEEIIFTSGGSESDNMAVMEIAYTNRKKGKHIITSKIEHHAVLHPCEFLEKNGFEASFLKVDRQGFVDLGQLEKEVSEKTTLVSVMHANNEIGTIEPIKEIAEIAHSKQAYFHTDAVQTVGKEKIDVEKIGVDLLSASAHKFFGPKGTGFLYVKKGTNIHPLIMGGSQEHKLRAGTENTAGIVGMAKALEICEKEKEGENPRERKLAKKLAAGALEIENSWINGPEIGQKRIANNVNLGFDFVEGESMLLMLDDLGIACSTGSACSSHDLSPSHVLIAIGLKPWQAHGSLRFSFGRATREKEIDFVLENLKEIVEKLREISPLYKGGKYDVLGKSNGIV